MNRSHSFTTAAAAITGVAALISLIVAVALIAESEAQPRLGASAEQIADLHEPGIDEVTYARRAARLQRRDDGVTISVEFPTPAPGSYEYPSPDQVPPGASPHPDIVVGDEATPEIFTLWAFVFNQPERCTQASCDTDDIGPDTAAQGGIYQVDGRFAVDESTLFGGTVRIGQPANTGANLFNPIGAEIHVAVAAHGRVLSGDDLQRQLNSSVGNPQLWWAAAFTAE